MDAQMVRKYGRRSRRRATPPALAMSGILLLAALSGASAPEGGRTPAPGSRVETGLAGTGAGAAEALGATPAPIGVTSIVSAAEAGRLSVFLTTSAPASYREFRLAKPHRLVLDLEDAENRSKIRELPVDSRHIRSIRVGQFQVTPSRVLRVVFDLASGDIHYEIARDGSVIRVEFADPARPAAAGESGPAVMAPPALQHAVAGGAEMSSPADRSALPILQDDAQAKPAPSATPATRDRAAGNGERVPPQEALARPPQDRPQPTPAPAATPAKPAEQEPGNQPVRFTGTPLTLDLVDIPLIDFFRLMAEEGGINLVMDPEIKGSISIRVVKVPWDQIFEAALSNNGLDKLIEGNFVRIARRATLQEEAKQRESLKKATLLAADLETRVKKLNYAKAATMLPTLLDQKSVRGTLVVDERTNSLILTDLPSYLDRIIELIASLDVAQPQVQIEARIVSATREFARDIGVQFGFVQGNLERVTVGGPNTFGTIGGTRPAATPNTTYAAGNPRTGRGASEATASASAGVSTGSASQNAGNFNVNLPSTKAFGGIGISVGNIIDTFLLDAAITAGENRGEAKLISQPRVTAQNNSPAQITQGLRFPVQIISNNTITVQFQNAALTLNVTPQITAEGNIVLDLQVENNTPDFSRAVNGIPSIRTSESRTRVLVTDGGTTVIGGILLENEQTNEDRVPGLASLPFVGNVFRRNSVSKTTQEVLFFITPSVIK